MIQLLFITPTQYQVVPDSLTDEYRMYEIQYPVRNINHGSAKKGLEKSSHHTDVTWVA